MWMEHVFWVSAANVLFRVIEKEPAIVWTNLYYFNICSTSALRITHYYILIFFSGTYGNLHNSFLNSEYKNTYTVLLFETRIFKT